MELKRDEIIKALECCINPRDSACDECPLDKYGSVNCKWLLASLALDVINGLTEDIEWSAKRILEADKKVAELTEENERLRTEGEWTKEVTDLWHCSLCLHPTLLNGGEEYVLSNFCPHCGAKMKGGE